MIHPIVNEMTVQNVLFLMCHPKGMDKKKTESIVFNLGACMFFSEIGLTKTILGMVRLRTHITRIEKRNESNFTAGNRIVFNFKQKLPTTGNEKCAITVGNDYVLGV